MKNVAVSYIKAKNNIDGDLHAFEVVNVEWVPINTIHNTPKLSEAIIIVAKCFLKHGLLFCYNPIKGMPEKINIRKLRATDKRFGLGFMPLKKDYARSVRIQKERRMTWIIGRETNEEDLKIPYLHESFPQLAYMRRAG
jgi:hypothetical protein